MRRYQLDPGTVQQLGLDRGGTEPLELHHVLVRGRAVQGVEQQPLLQWGQTVDIGRRGAAQERAVQLVARQARFRKVGGREAGGSLVAAMGDHGAEPFQEIGGYRPSTQAAGRLVVIRV